MESKNVVDVSDRLFFFFKKNGPFVAAAPEQKHLFKF